MAISQELAVKYHMTTEQINPRALGGTLGSTEQDVISGYLAQNPPHITPRETQPSIPLVKAVPSRSRSRFGLSDLVSGISLGLVRLP